jgi:MFS transporter, DHA1 family, multidrug resistance protein
MSYLVYTYLLYTASALAGHMIICLATGAAFPLFMMQIFLNLGTNWAAMLLSKIVLLLAPISFLFYKYGLRICTKSLFVPCINLKVQSCEVLQGGESDIGGEEARVSVGCPFKGQNA